MDNLQMLVSDLTVEQFCNLLGRIFGFLLLFFCIFHIGFRIFNFIFDLVSGFIRKDKYKSIDYSIILAYRYISRLRKQVKNAPNEKSYFLYYNQLVGVVGFLLYMGYINTKFTKNILDVRSDFKVVTLHEKS